MRNTVFLEHLGSKIQKSLDEVFVGKKIKMEKDTIMCLATVLQVRWLSVGGRNFLELKLDESFSRSENLLYIENPLNGFEKAKVNLGAGIKASGEVFSAISKKGPYIPGTSIRVEFDHSS